MNFAAPLFIVVCAALFWFFVHRKPGYFYSTADYPVVKAVENEWQNIAQEIPPFDSSRMQQYVKRSRTAWNNKEAEETLPALKSEWMQGWQGHDVWYNFPLMYHNQVIDRAGLVCPITIELLKTIPNVQIAGFSMLVPHSRLTPHTDLTGTAHGSMALNLPLTRNANASLYVLDAVYSHVTGKAVIFDATQEHWADNKSNEPRTILYIDFKT